MCQDAKTIFRSHYSLLKIFMTWTFVSSAFRHIMQKFSLFKTQQMILKWQSKNRIPWTSVGIWAAKELITSIQSPKCHKEKMQKYKEKKSVPLTIYLLQKQLKDHSIALFTHWCFIINLFQLTILSKAWYLPVH